MEAIPIVFNKPLLKMDLRIADTAFDQDIGHLTLETSLRFFFFNYYLCIWGFLCSTRRIIRNACFITEIEFL